MPDTLLLSAADDLGFVYGLFEISRRFLGVQPFWFWNDQPFTVREGEKIPVGTVVESKSYKVKYRGWFVNDETLLSHWKVERRANLPFVMAFETLLRLGGNMVIPGHGQKRRAVPPDGCRYGAYHHPPPRRAAGRGDVCPSLPRLRADVQQVPREIPRLVAGGY